MDPVISFIGIVDLYDSFPYILKKCRAYNLCHFAFFRLQIRNKYYQIRIDLLTFILYVLSTFISTVIISQVINFSISFHKRNCFIIFRLVLIYRTCHARSDIFRVS